MAVRLGPAPSALSQSGAQTVESEGAGAEPCVRSRQGVGLTLLCTLSTENVSGRIMRGEISSDEQGWKWRDLTFHSMPLDLTLKYQFLNKHVISTGRSFKQNKLNRGAMGIFLAGERRGMGFYRCNSGPLERSR